MKARSDYRAAVIMKNRLHHNQESPSIQVSKDAHDKDKKFSPKDAHDVEALEVISIQDGNIGLHIQVLRGDTHPNGVGSELTFFLLESLFLLQLFSFTVIAIHCNRRCV